jgi:hypothetical protein
VCGRPLAVGAPRCVACGTRLVQGVALGKAAAFVVVGLLVGGLLGAGGAAGLAAVAGTSASSAAASPAPTDARPTAGPSGPAASAAVPGIVSSAITQAALTNQRMAEHAVALQAALDASPFEAQVVAGLLRNIATDAAFGVELTARSMAWAGAGELSDDLGEFYEEVRAEARDGLAASTTNAPAYRGAAETMVGLISGDLGAMNGGLSAFAAGNGIDLPELPPIPDVPGS